MTSTEMEAALDRLADQTGASTRADAVDVALTMLDGGMWSRDVVADLVAEQASLSDPGMAHHFDAVIRHFRLKKVTP